MATAEQARGLVLAEARRQARTLAPAYPGWAWSEDSEQLIRYTVLMAEKRRRAGLSLFPDDEPPEDALLRRLTLDHLSAYVLHRDRQAAVCGAMGLPWPPPPDSAPRPWVWPWEPSPSPALPVVYPADWRPLAEPDRHGFAEEWTPGEVRIVTADRLAVEVPQADEVEVPDDDPRDDDAGGRVRIPPADVAAREGRPSPLLAERLTREFRRGKGLRMRAEPGTVWAGSPLEEMGGGKGLSGLGAFRVVVDDDGPAGS